MRWKLAAVLGWSIVGVVLLTGAVNQGEVRAKRLVIEDDQGRDRLVMTTIEGLPRIELSDEYGNGQIMISSAGRGRPMILMSGADGKTRINLGLGTASNGHIALTDGADRRRLHLRVPETDEPPFKVEAMEAP